MLKVDTSGVKISRLSESKVSTDPKTVEMALVLLWAGPGFSRVSVRSGDTQTYLANQHRSMALICWSAYRSRPARELLRSVSTNSN
jgi:hypothetical protein